MLALLLQAASLFPTAPTPPEADAAFRARMEALAAQDEWLLEEINALRAEADEDAEWAAVVALIREGDHAQVRLGALLASGQGSGPVFGREWVSDALFEVGCTHADEAVALACLLAPNDPPNEWWPALLMRAQDPLAELPVRAGALARLLDGGCLEVWPLARSVLRTGTAIDEPAPWADWKRGGRYELPKRLLVLSLDRVLEQRGEAGCGFEPNAPWPDQVEQLAALEPRLWEDGRPVGRVPGKGIHVCLPQDGEAPADWPYDTRGYARLRELALEGDLPALRAYAILHPGSASPPCPNCTPAEELAAARRRFDQRKALRERAAALRPR